MKLSIKLVLPLFSTAVFGNFLGNSLEVEGVLESISFYGGSETCTSELARVKNCISSVTKDNINDACSNYHTETCQTFYSNPLKLAPSCDTNSMAGDFIVNTVNLVSVDMKVKCQKDENGNDCPLADLELNNEDAPNEVVLEAIKNSCQSRICRENALDLLGYVNDMSLKASSLLQSSISQIAGVGSISEDSLNSILQDQTTNGEEIQSYINVLKEDTCMAQANASTGNIRANTSDAIAISIRSFSSLFISITIILIYNYLY